MSFIQAIAAAPADADFVAFKNIGGWVVIHRRSDGIWDTCANLTGQGYQIFCAGINVREQSLWSYESGQFVAGNVEQLLRFSDKLEA